MFLLSAGFLRTGDMLRVVVLHHTIGTTIDSAEKVQYHWFPFWTVSEFDQTEIILNSDSTFTLYGTMKDGSVRQLPCSREEFK